VGSEGEALAEAERDQMPPTAPTKLDLSSTESDVSTLLIHMVAVNSSHMSTSGSPLPAPRSLTGAEALTLVFSGVISAAGATEPRAARPSTPRPVC